MLFKYIINAFVKKRLVMSLCDTVLRTTTQIQCKILETRKYVFLSGKITENNPLYLISEAQYHTIVCLINYNEVLSSQM